MAPQIKEKNDGSEEGSQATVAMNLPSWKSLPTFAERDKAVRSQEDRRRGWSDYRVLFVGTDASKGQLSEEEIIRALSGNTERCQTQGRSGHDTWNLFGVGGEEKIVSLLTPPVMYGRFPNYRARDLVIQSADAIILVTTPHIHVHKNAVATFEMVRKSLEGSFQNSFRYGTQVSNASLEKVKELDASQPRPVYILLSESRAKYDLECQKLKEERQRMKLTERPTPTFEEAVQKVRNECETFMKDFGEAHGVKLITLPDDCEAADLRPFVLQACEDASNNVGVQFQVKKVSEAPLNLVRKLTPIESKATPGERVRAVNYIPPHKRGIAAYPTLDKIVSVVGEDTKKNDNKNNNNWNLITPQLLSFDSTD